MMIVDKQRSRAHDVMPSKRRKKCLFLISRKKFDDKEENQNLIDITDMVNCNCDSECNYML
jgi:hypothetical protein